MPAYRHTEMGSILLSVSSNGSAAAQADMARMAACSPHRGELRIHADNELILGVQSLDDDAWLLVTPDLVVAFHGYIANPDYLQAVLGARKRTRKKSA